MLALIPARGGSKGIPRKNLVLLGGKPLIQYTIEAALQSQSVSRIVLTPGYALPAPSRVGTGRDSHGCHTDALPAVGAPGLRRLR
jgi:hypothetical protein